MEALFTSLVGGDVLRRRVLELIAEAAALAGSTKVDLHAMMFAFTDVEIADALTAAALSHPSMTIRMLADWSQRNHVRGQQVVRLARLNLPNLQVRYKNDQPYLWDAEAAHVRWSYRVSRGLLHHKTLGLLVNGRPRRLICGSFNWTASAARSYENLLIVTSDEPGSCRLMSRMELEFEALWSDSRLTLSPEEAHLHYRAIIDEFRSAPTISPDAIVGLGRGRGEPLKVLDPDGYPPDCDSICTDFRDEPLPPTGPRVAIAFNSRCCAADSDSQCGHAECNRTQRFFLRTPSAKTRRVPLTLTNLALDTIFRTSPGETLKVAMYGLSARVPEYGALLDAARRGVRLLVLLDGIVGRASAARLTLAGQGLPIQVRTVCRMMHQKYIVSPESATVLTGTANMSTDASSRHLEHRIRVSGDRELSTQFSTDFDTIWARLKDFKQAAALPAEVHDSLEPEGRMSPSGGTG